MMKNDEGMLQQQAWNYFEVVAAQRLTTLNFYVGLASAWPFSTTVPLS